jgi:hypothetical protein
MKPSTKNVTQFSFYSLTELPTSMRDEFYLPANPVGSFKEWGKEAVDRSYELLKDLKVILFQAQGTGNRVFPYGVNEMDVVQCWYYYGAAYSEVGKGFKIACWNSPENKNEEEILLSRINKAGDAAIWYIWGQEVTVTNIKKGITRL